MNLNGLTDIEREKLMKLQYATLERGGEFIPTGSRQIGGYTEESDYDFVISWPGIIALKDYLIEERFETGSGSVRGSYRNGQLNVIVSSYSELTFWKRATKIATLLRLKDKESRVCLFEALRCGNSVSVRNYPVSFDSGEPGYIEDNFL